MKQKLLIVILTLALVVSLGLLVQASSNELTVVINGETQSYNQPPVIIKGSTLVPLRGIFESLGATVSWNGETKIVTATSGNTKIFLKIGSVDTTVNGKNIKISVPAQIINKSTMVPLRFVSEALGASVGWDGNTRTITIQYSPKVKDTNNKTANNVNETHSVFYKQSNIGIRLAITEDEFNNMMDASTKYLEDENYLTTPLPKELEPLKIYEYQKNTTGENGIYTLLNISIGEGLENVIGSTTPYIAYTESTGTIADKESLNLDATYYIYPILTDKVPPKTYYEYEINRSVPLSVFNDLIIKTELEKEKDTEIINFEDKELENMIRRALGKKSTEMITERDIANIVSVEIMGPYIHIIKKNGLDLINLGDFKESSIDNYGNCIIDGEEKSYLGNISNLKDISKFPKLVALKVSFQPNLVSIDFLPGSTNLLRLDLRANNLNDISGLSNLKNLMDLNLSRNKISNISSIATLKNLEKIRMYKNEITDISPLKGLKKLKVLELHYNNISDISAIGELKELEVLYFYKNNISDISSVSSLNRLQRLSLSNNKIENIQPVTYLKNLTYLSLGGMNLEDISQISVLTQLTDLKLYDNKITDISPLVTLKNLQILELYNNKISYIYPVSRLTNLKSLYIDGNLIKDYSSLGNLTNLTKLEIDGDDDFDDFDLIQ